MQSCQRILLACLVSLLVAGKQAAPSASVSPSPLPSRSSSTTVSSQMQQVEEPQFVVITEDVIPDVENTTQKVIRVNPLDLPSAKDDASTGSVDSSLYKIQSLLPHTRSYVNSNRMRKQRPLQRAGDSPIIRQLPAAGDSPIKRQLPGVKLPKPEKPQSKQKQLHFLYNQQALDGRLVSRTMRVHVVPGAYPVYYAVSKSNGRFGKHPLKGFSNQQDFLKYLLKSKLQPVDLAQHFES